MASRAREAAEAAIAGLSDSVREANEGFSGSMNEMFVSTGKWQREGDTYVKDVVTHSTVADPYITERANVAAYAYYAIDAWSLSTDLSDGTLEDMDPLGIQALIMKAQGEVGKKGEEVFGTAEENAEGADIPESRKHTIEYYKDVQTPHTRIVTNYTRDGEEYEVEETYYTTHKELDESRRVEKTIGAGFFGAHIGYDPSVADNADPGNGEDSIFQDKGNGELGRLMAKYIYWSMVEGKGWSEANKPLYEKDLWDDRGDWFQAPSIRGVADIGVTVAAGILTGGVGAAAMNLADDAIFGALDVSGGYKGWEVAGLEFGKKALSSAVSTGVSGAFSGGFASLDAMGGGVSKIVGKTMLTGMRSYTTGFATSAINSLELDYDDEGNITGLGFNDDAFSSGIQGGLVSAATGMASTITSGSMGLWNLNDGNGIGLSSNVFNTNAINNLNGFVGGLAGQGLNYAMTGEATFNLANFSMFGMTDAKGQLVSSGLLELHLGKDGASMNLGTGGMDASFGTIAASLSGLEETVKIGGAKTAALFGQLGGLSSLNAVNMLGYTNDGFDEALGRRIWSGRLKARYGDTGDDWGSYEAESPDSILLSEKLLGGGKEEAAKLATVMAHEGTHAAGNRYESVAHQQGMWAYQNLMSTFGLAGDGAFAQGMISALMDPTSYVANTENVDHWKIKLDGTMEDTDDRAFYREYIGADGKVHSEKVEGSDYKGSRAMALYGFLGEDMVAELLSSTSTDLDRFDSTVLKEVLGWDDKTLHMARKVGYSLADISPELQQKIKIENCLQIKAMPTPMVTSSGKVLV